MDNSKINIDEKIISYSKNQIIKEAKRIEELLIFSSKGHFVAAYFWNRFHLWVGIPIAILSAIIGVSALSQFDPNHIVTGIVAIFVAGLSSIMTFINPNERAGVHLDAGNNYDSLLNKIRIFWTIDCWQNESGEVLVEKLKLFCEQKDNLNRNSPQIPKRAYKKAKKGIELGESSFSVDRGYG